MANQKFDVSNFTFPNHEADLILARHASIFAIGGVLQQHKSGEWLPVSFFPKNVSETATGTSLLDE